MYQSYSSLSKTLQALIVNQRTEIQTKSRAWCKTIVTTSFYIRSYNSFAPSPRNTLVQNTCVHVTILGTDCFRKKKSISEEISAQKWSLPYNWSVILIIEILCYKLQKIQRFKTFSVSNLFANTYSTPVKIIHSDSLFQFVKISKISKTQKYNICTIVITFFCIQQTYWDKTSKLVY